MILMEQTSILIYFPCLVDIAQYYQTKGNNRRYTSYLCNIILCTLGDIKYNTNVALKDLVKPVQTLGHQYHKLQGQKSKEHQCYEWRPWRILHLHQIAILRLAKYLRIF